MFKFMYIYGNAAEANACLADIASKKGVEIQMRHLETTYSETSRQNVTGLMDEAEAIGADVIICRGGSELMLRKYLSNYKIPILPVRFLGSSTIALMTDVYLRNPEMFENPPVKAAIFSHQPLVIDKKSINALFNAELENVLLDDIDPEYIRKKLEESVARGVRFILAGRRVSQIGARLGIQVFYKQDNDERETLERMVDEAVMMAKNLKIQRERAALLENLMDYSYEAVLFINSEGMIEFANSVAGELLGHPGSECLGRYIWDEIPELGKGLMDKILMHGEKIYGNVIRVRERLVLVNALPYDGKNISSGAILHLSQKEKLDDLEGRMRKALFESGHTAKYCFDDIIGASSTMNEARYKALQFARHDANILIYGETGTGKELFAQSMHSESSRRNQPFVAINCGALPEGLIESELFGYVGGAFTGASKQGKKGLIESADKGTVFLDEISEMDPQGQIRLLRVIEERLITRVGDNRVIPVDVRIIAASNKNLLKLVTEGKFRADLYYRLNVLSLNIPPLRERKTDIRNLGNAFIKRFGQREHKELELSGEAWGILEAYAWPGNVRQLRNFFERLVIISRNRKLDGTFIAAQLKESCPDPETPIPTQASCTPRPEPGDKPGTAEGGYDREYLSIRNALDKCGGNQTRAARLLGIGRTSLWRKMKKYGINRG